MSSFDHIILYCLLYLTAEEYGNYKKYNVKYLKILFVLFYVIIEGLRYGRGNDQNYVYGPEYLRCLSGSVLRENMEPIYMLILRSVRTFDPFIDVFVFGSIFIVYAFIFIFCLLKLHSGFRQYTTHFLLFALLATLYITEWPIRTGVGFSFMLPAIFYLTQCDLSRWKSDANFWMAILFLAIPPFIHKGDTLGCVLILVFFLFCNRNIISWKVSLPLLLVLELTSTATGLMNTLFNYLSVIDVSNGIDDKFQHYLDVSTFEKEIDDSLNGERSAFTQILAIGYYSSMIIVGYIVTTFKRHSIWIYNLFVCSMLIAEPFRLLGSVIRMFTPTSVLWFIPMSIAAYYYKEFKANKIFFCCYWFFIAYLAMYYGRFVFFNPEAQYVWSVDSI